MWICNDVLMDILPFVERVELGLNLALLSPRFNALVNTHFNGQSDLAICKAITICKDIAEQKAKISVWIDGKSVDFPLPDRPWPNKIRIHFIRIEYIDHFVIEFLRANQQIFDKGTNLYLHLCSSECNVQPIYSVFVRQIWPVFTTTNLHHLTFQNSAHLDNLLRLTSPTILTDLKQLHSISSFGLLPDAIVDDKPNATPTAGQVLSKWLHSPTENDQPKELHCTASLYRPPPNLELITNFKEAFLRATTSAVSYTMNFALSSSTPIDLFEMENERTKEKLTLEKMAHHPCNWLMKRCPINWETAAFQWENDENLDANLNNVTFMLTIDNNCIGPLAPPAKEKVDQSMENVV